MQAHTHNDFESQMEEWEQSGESLDSADLAVPDDPFEGAPPLPVDDPFEMPNVRAQ